MSIDQFLDGLTDFADYFPKFETSFTYTFHKSFVKL